MNRSIRLASKGFGCLIAFAGFEHGLGELLQGNRTPASIFIDSWPDAESLKLLSGEPAMTLVPNLLVTGILAMLVSTLFALWSVALIQRRRAGLELIGLSVLMLLVGGGFGPPLMGVMVGAIATRIDAPLAGWRRLVPRSLGRLLAVLFWPTFIGALVGYLTMVPGFVILVPLLKLENPTFVMVLALGSLACFFTALIAAVARDAEAR